VPQTFSFGAPFLWFWWGGDTKKTSPADQTNFWLEAQMADDLQALLGLAEDDVLETEVVAIHVDPPEGEDEDDDYGGADGKSASDKDPAPVDRESSSPLRASLEEREVDSDFSEEDENALSNSGSGSGADSSRAPAPADDVVVVSADNSSSDEAAAPRPRLQHGAGGDVAGSGGSAGSELSSIANLRETVSEELRNSPPPAAGDLALLLGSSSSGYSGPGSTVRFSLLDEDLTSASAPAGGIAMGSLLTDSQVELLSDNEDGARLAAAPEPAAGDCDTDSDYESSEDEDAAGRSVRFSFSNQQQQRLQQRRAGPSPFLSRRSDSAITRGQKATEQKRQEQARMGSSGRTFLTTSSAADDPILQARLKQQEARLRKLGLTSSEMRQISDWVPPPPRDSINAEFAGVKEASMRLSSGISGDDTSVSRRESHSFHQLQRRTQRHVLSSTSGRSSPKSGTMWVAPIATDSTNRHKNRYTDVLPYEATRVVLAPRENPETFNTSRETLTSSKSSSRREESPPSSPPSPRLLSMSQGSKTLSQSCGAVLLDALSDTSSYESSGSDGEDAMQDSGTYINASFIHDHRRAQTQVYISAQAPLPSTVEDFWRMIFQTQSPVIVMLTRLVENNRVKAHSYWPEGVGETHKYVELSVTNVCESLLGPIRYRRFLVTPRLAKVACDSGDDRAQSEALTVHHLQYLEWPDMGVPPDVSGMERLIREVDIRKGTLEQPITVHCSAGIGRTGTFIAVHMNRQLALMNTGPAAEKTPAEINVRQTVLDLRRQRKGMVQTAEQYKFAHVTLNHVLARHELPSRGSRKARARRRDDDPLDDIGPVPDQRDQTVSCMCCVLVCLSLTPPPDFRRLSRSEILCFHLLARGSARALKPT
jgi:protein tyrosine phosphatase